MRVSVPARCLFLIAVLRLLMPDLVAAADAPPTTDQMFRKLGTLPPYPWVRIQFDDGRLMEAEYHGKSDDSLRLLSRDAGEVTVPADSVAALAIKGHGLGAGFLVGAGVGALGMALTTAPILWTYVLLGGAVIALVGILAGAAIGALLGGFIAGAFPRWDPVYDRDSNITGLHAWAGSPVSAQGYAAFFSLQPGYAFSTDRGAPEGGPGAIGRFFVPLGRIVGTGVEFGYFDLGDEENFGEASLLLRFSVPIDRVQPYAQIGLGWYGFEYDETRYDPDGIHGSQNHGGVGGQTTLGVSVFPRRTPFFVSGELAWHRGWFSDQSVHPDGTEVGRGLSVLSATASISYGW